jgi:hypothetical protein
MNLIQMAVLESLIDYYNKVCWAGAEKKILFEVNGIQYTGDFLLPDRDGKRMFYVSDDAFGFDVIYDYLDYQTIKSDFHNYINGARKVNVLGQKPEILFNKSIEFVTKDCNKYVGANKVEPVAIYHFKNFSSKQELEFYIPTIEVIPVSLVSKFDFLAK